MSDPDNLSPHDLSYETDHLIGQDNTRIFGLDAHNPVFFLSAGLIVTISCLTLLFPQASAALLQQTKALTLQRFDWLFAVTPIIVLAFCLFLALSPLGKIRLGGSTAKPDFGTLSWISMLFAAGVGIGFMFWGAAEPLAYYTDWYGSPLNAEANSAEARRLAFSATLFHWGIAPWGIYAVIGLSLGFFAHNKGLPLSMRSVFYPLLGERVWGWPGNLIDLFAVVSTVFGLATTIGLGGVQAATGLGYMAGFEPGIGVQIGLIMTMTLLAIISVTRGMNGGVKVLSNINMLGMAGLMIFVFICGPTHEIFTGFGRYTLAYLQDLPALSNWIQRADINWFHDWTIFYWAWWISWSPFVGMFIARISRGRTVRQYLGTILLITFGICVLWFVTFGETALTAYDRGQSEITEGIVNSAVVLFQVLAILPYPLLTGVIAIVLLIVFIVTSADSGALVIDTITSGGKTDAPVGQRAFWTFLLGLTASALLYGGGTGALETLQAGTIVAALPFNFVLLASCLCLYLGMRGEPRLPVPDHNPVATQNS